MPDDKTLFIKVTEDQATWIGAYLNVAPMSLIEGVQQAFDRGVERTKELVLEADLEPWVVPAYTHENSSFRQGWRGAPKVLMP